MAPKIVGNGHLHKIEMVVNDDGQEQESFMYRGNRYFLNEFCATRHGMWSPAQEWTRGFDGYLFDSAFSGILIKLVGGDYGFDGVKVYTFY